MIVITKLFIFLCLLLFIMALSACVLRPTPSLRVASTNSPSQPTPVQTTVQPTATPIVSPTMTASPSPTPSATPVPPAKALTDEQRAKLPPLTIYLAGDSTVAQFGTDQTPGSGWGAKIVDYFDNRKVTIENKAVGGASTKSFMPLWMGMRNDFIKGDYVLIQFGHNDEGQNLGVACDIETYKTNLTQFVTEARQHGATPILVTSPERNAFRENGEFYYTHGGYPAAMKQVATDLKVPLIDLSEKTASLFIKLGKDETQKLFLYLKPGESPNYPNGSTDNTHFIDHGAHVLAGLIVQGLWEVGSPLSQYVATYPPAS